MKQSLIIIFLAALSCFMSCSNNTKNQPSSNHIKSSNMTIIEATMKQVLDAFNRHDLDAIMEFFSEDCSFYFPRGPEPWGKRFVGKAKVREGLASRFKGIPDVHYGEDVHWLSADGNKGVSKWTLTGTTTSGIKLNVRGCDLWEFNNGKITRKNSYWKIVEH